MPRLECGGYNFEPVDEGNGGCERKCGIYREERKARDEDHGQGQSETSGKAQTETQGKSTAENRSACRNEALIINPIIRGC